MVPLSVNVVSNVPKGLALMWLADMSREDQEQCIYNALVSGLSLDPVAFEIPLRI